MCKNKANRIVFLEQQTAFAPYYKDANAFYIFIKKP